MSTTRLLALIDEFQMRVQEAVGLFEKRFGVHPSNRRDAGISRGGFMDDAKTLRYAFHGIGLYLELPSGPVDWDFGYDGRCDGFDKWRLGQFADEGSPNFPEFAHTDLLDTTFAELVTTGTIKQLHRDKQDSLYYLETRKWLYNVSQTQ